MSEDAHHSAGQASCRDSGSTWESPFAARCNGPHDCQPHSFLLQPAFPLRCTGVSIPGSLLCGQGDRRAVALRHGAAPLPQPPGSAQTGSCCRLPAHDVDACRSPSWHLRCSTCVSPIGDRRASHNLSQQPPRTQLAHAAAEQGRAVSVHAESCHHRTQETVQSLTNILSPQVGAKTTAGLLQLIQAERNGDTVNQQLLAHLLRMLSSLGTYQTAFQVLLLYVAACCSWEDAVIVLSCWSTLVADAICPGTCNQRHS